MNIINIHNYIINVNVNRQILIIRLSSYLVYFNIPPKHIKINNISIFIIIL